MDTKQCTTCKRVLPLSEFYRRSASEAETRLERRWQSSCKSCMNTSRKAYRSDPVKYQRELAGRRRFRVLHPERARKQDRKRKLKQMFGISVEDYSRLFAFQGGLCAICGKPESAILFGKPKRLAVDHDHDSGQVRGLLCSRCNTAIGLMNDDVDILEKAQDYLLSPIAFPLTAESRRSR